ncbi:MAG: hypothetical protein EOO73_18765 [Myxococcales bacterium]|nr:MAG: hypothetical protein EOO73_18765 [Myxococcales bacterium]
MADEPRPEIKVDAKSKTVVKVEHEDRQTPGPFGTGPVKADPFVLGDLKGLATWHVALTIKQQLEDAVAEVRAAGALMTSSGGLRDLGAPVTTARSGTSFHYTGRAIDLYKYSGMNNLETDPYIVTGDPDVGKWRIFARSSDTTLPEQALIGFKKRFVKRPVGKTFDQTVKLDSVEVTGRFIDLTAMMLKHGFKSIPARPDFLANENARDYDSAEWWHFQQEAGLVVGRTTFGSLLLQVHTSAQLKNTGPGNASAAVWNGRIFQ